MKLISIGEIGEIVSGSTPKTGNKQYWGGEISWATPKDISQLDSPYLNDTDRKITKLGLESCSAKLLPKGSILFTSRAPIGLVAIAKIETATNQGFKSIILNDGYYPLYIFYAIKYSSVQLNKLGTGTTFKELSKETFQKFKIPVPDLIDQIKIATVLEYTETIIRQRKKSLDLIDNLLKNAFLKMFGSPSQNEKRFEMVSIRDLVAEVKYGTSKSGNHSGSYQYLRMNNITSDGFMDYSEVKSIDIPDNNKEDYVVRKGDLLFNRTNSKELVGKAAVFDDEQEMIIAGYLLRIRAKPDASNWYLWGYLNSAHGKQTLKAMAKSIVGMANINAQEFQEIKILKPPTAQQNQYAMIAEQVMETRKQFLFSQEKYKDLFASLSQRAFNGDLNLSLLNVDIKEQNYHKEVIPDLKKPVKKNVIKKTVKKTVASKMIWEDVSVQQVADWIKEKYTGFHFNMEMLMRFLQEEHVIFPDYFSSEELKIYPHLNEKDDLKSFLFSAINKDNTFLKLHQFFHNEKESRNEILLTEEDNDLIKGRSIDERSGIYFAVEQ